MAQVAHTITGQLQEFFKKATEKAFGEVQADIEVSRATQGAFGHYQFNSAMKLAKELKMKPREIAEKILSSCEETDFIEKLEVAGPGFINITLKTSFLEDELQSMLTNERFGIKAARSQRVVIDFSSPNTAKEMHVGHLRSTIIGDCLARTFEFLGDSVLRLNHVGDWGTSFGMLIAYIKDRDSLEGAHVSDLVTYYKSAKKLFDEDPEFKKRAQLEVVALQAGDKETLRYWEIICEISRKAYQEIYDLLGIKIQERGESFYNSLLKGVVADLEEKGLVEISEGAKCIYLDGFLMVKIRLSSLQRL